MPRLRRAVTGRNSPGTGGEVCVCMVGVCMYVGGGGGMK